MPEPSTLSGHGDQDAPVAPERCPAIGDVGAVQPQMDRGNVASFTLRGARCVAYASEPPWYLHTHRCPNKAKHEVGGYAVCGTHQRIALRWQDEGRLDLMVASKWAAR